MLGPKTLSISWWTRVNGCTLTRQMLVNWSIPWKPWEPESILGLRQGSNQSSALATIYGTQPSSTNYETEFRGALGDQDPDYTVDEMDIDSDLHEIVRPMFLSPFYPYALGSQAIPSLLHRHSNLMIDSSPKWTIDWTFTSAHAGQDSWGRDAPSWRCPQGTQNCCIFGEVLNMFSNRSCFLAECGVCRRCHRGEQ